MSISLSIKNVPDELVAALRARAARNHRSIQGELMAILEEAVAPSESLSPSAVLKRVRELRLSTEGEASEMIRADRDAR